MRGGRVHRRQPRRRRLRRRHVRRRHRVRAGERRGDRIARPIDALSIRGVRQRLRGVRAPADGPRRELARLIAGRVQHLRSASVGVALRHPGHDRPRQTAVRVEQGTAGGLHERGGEDVRKASGARFRLHSPYVDSAGAGRHRDATLRVFHRQPGARHALGTARGAGRRGGVVYVRHLSPRQVPRGRRRVQRHRGGSKGCEIRIRVRGVQRVFVVHIPYFLFPPHVGGHRRDEAGPRVRHRRRVCQV